MKGSKHRDRRRASTDSQPAGQDADAAPGPAEASFSAWLRSWRYFFLVLGVIVTVALFYLEENWRGERAWETYKQGLDARGEPREATDWLPPGVSDEHNFAMTPFLLAVMGKPGQPAAAQSASSTFGSWYDRASSEIKPVKSPRSNSWTRPPIDLAAWYAAFLKTTNTPARQGQEPALTNFTRTAAAAGVLAALADCEPVIEELRVASSRPFARFNLNYQQEDPATIMLPHLAGLKRVCLVLQLRASAELALGRSEEALQDIELMLHVADAVRDEPVLISELVRITEVHIALQALAEGLAGHQWSEPQLKALEERLRRFDLCADGKRTLQAECAFFGCREIAYMRRSRRAFGLMGWADDMAGKRGSGAAAAAILVLIAPDGWFDFEQRNYSRQFHDCLLPALDPPNQRVSPALCAQADQRISAFSSNSLASLFLRHRLFSALLLPNGSTFMRKSAFAQTGLNAAAIACALERYRLAHGQFPDSLDSLAPQWPGALPHDLITGQPLKYRRTADGHFLLYSVGWNELDDGGLVQMTKSGDNVDSEKGDWVFTGALEQKN